jgi:hypothetical protein
MKQWLYHLLQDTRGNMLMAILVFGAATFMIITTGVSSYALFEHHASLRQSARQSAFHIAEAGIEYYRWHLAHAPTDYQDGTGESGPYVHEYTDKFGDIIGYFSLTVEPPLPGSTVVTIQSTGWTTALPEVQRTIQIRVGFPALTDYTFLSHANMNFSFTTEVHGSVHSNGGIRFDGETDSWVRSAKDRYQYQNQWHDGVWGGGGPRSFWEFPVPEIDFVSVSADVSAIQDAAEDGGVSLSSSGVEGWHIVFEGTTFDLYRVTSRDCYYGEGVWRNRGWRGRYWDGVVYCHDIRTEVFDSTHAIPDNGAIFVDDDVWVEGVVDGRVTVASGRFPVQEPYHTLYISHSLVYEEQSSDDVIGLLAQGHIIVPYEVPETMDIQAAMLSQFGSIYRPYYDENEKELLRIFGSQISYAGGGWKYVNGWGNVISGFVNTSHTYDGALRLNPPPGFPVGDTYELLSWEEVE